MNNFHFIIDKVLYNQYSKNYYCKITNHFIKRMKNKYNIINFNNKLFTIKLNLNTDSQYVLNNNLEMLHFNTQKINKSLKKIKDGYFFIIDLLLLKITSKLNNYKYYLSFSYDNIELFNSNFFELKTKNKTNTLFLHDKYNIKKTINSKYKPKKKPMKKAKKMKELSIVSNIASVEILHDYFLTKDMII